MAAATAMSSSTGLHQGADEALDVGGQLPEGRLEVRPRRREPTASASPRRRTGRFQERAGPTHGSQWSMSIPWRLEPQVRALERRQRFAIAPSSDSSDAPSRTRRSSRTSTMSIR